jgi:NifU-like protein
VSWEYSEKTTQLFMDAVHGKPGTHMGEIENPDGVGEHGSIACGDAMRFTFRVDRNAEDPTKDVIVESCYLTFGCTSAIASSEALCRMIEERHCSPIEALQITNQDIVDYLNGLPEQKIHCSVMGAEALEAAVFNWAQKRGVDLQALGVDLLSGNEEDGRIVCRCFSLTEPYLRRRIKELELKTIAEVTNATKAGGACMSCHHAPGGIQDLLDEVWGKGETVVRTEAEPPAPVETAAAVALSPFQMMKKIEQVLETNIRPQLKADGGSIELVDIKDTVVYCKLLGACAGCAHAGQTLKLMVERTLKEMVDEQIRVISV